MILINILHFKVVYHKDEIHGAIFLPPEAWSASGYDVSIGGQMFSEVVFG